MPRKYPRSYTKALERLSQEDKRIVEHIVGEEDTAGDSPNVAVQKVRGYEDSRTTDRILAKPGVAKAAIVGLQLKEVTFQELFGLAKATLRDAMQPEREINTRLSGARITLDALKRTGEEISLSDTARAEDEASLTQLAEAILGANADQGTTH